jgi:hypothetical protein
VFQEIPLTMLSVSNWTSGRVNDTSDRVQSVESVTYVVRQVGN